MTKYVLILITSVFAVACNTTTKEDPIPLGERMLSQQLKDCLSDENFDYINYYHNEGHRFPVVDGRKLLVSRSTSKVMPDGIFCEVTDVTNWGKGI